MEAISQDDFVRWANSVGVGFDERFPQSHSLSLLPIQDHARFWQIPCDPAAWPHFAVTILQGLDDWRVGYLWPRGGKWPRLTQENFYNHHVRDFILRGVGIPAGWFGAFRFAREETARVVGVLFSGIAFGAFCDDDLFFVPGHGRQIVQTDHHDVIHVECRSEDRVEKLVTHMLEEGYDLPSEPPDWTFRRPKWMAS